MFYQSCVYPFRKVKDAWGNKRDMLVKSGAFAIEQLSEALSASASTKKLADGIPENASHLCADQVCLIEIRASTVNCLFLVNLKQSFLLYDPTHFTQKQITSDSCMIRTFVV